MKSLVEAPFDPKRVELRLVHTIVIGHPAAFENSNFYGEKILSVL